MKLVFKIIVLISYFKYATADCNNPLTPCQNEGVCTAGMPGTCTCRFPTTGASCENGMTECTPMQGAAVTCDAEPCLGAVCAGNPSATCTNILCGSCGVEWRISGNVVSCDGTSGTSGSLNIDWKWLLFLYILKRLREEEIRRQQAIDYYNWYYNFYLPNYLRFSRLG